MSFDIHTNKKEIVVEVTDIKENKERLLENFNNCKNGECKCPTNEYKKLDKLEIVQNPNNITLKLTPKGDQKFKVEEIEKCLQFSISSLKDGN